MDILKVRALWPEKQGFEIKRKDTGNEYIFIHYLTPVEVLEKGKWVQTEPGAVILYNKHDYQWFRAPKTDLVHDWMHITGDLDGIMQVCGLNYGTVYYPQISTAITKMMQELELEHMNRDFLSEHILSRKIEELLLRISRALYIPPESRTDIKITEMFLYARAQIHQCYDRHWSVAEMADLVHISPSRFYYLYQKIFGVSPKSDLQNVRMEHAMQLLAEKKYTVREIAAQIGYENEYYFIRKFKKITGKTPAKYGVKRE